MINPGGLRVSRSKYFKKYKFQKMKKNKMKIYDQVISLQQLLESRDNMLRFSWNDDEKETFQDSQRINKQISEKVSEIRSIANGRFDHDFCDAELVILLLAYGGLFNHGSYFNLTSKEFHSIATDSEQLMKLIEGTILNKTSKLNYFLNFDFCRGSYSITVKYPELLCAYIKECTGSEE